MMAALVPLFLLLATLAGSVRAQAAMDPRVEAADRLFAERTRHSGAPTSLAVYETLLREDDRSVEVLVKAARACHWVADNTVQRRQKIALLEKGVLYAERAVELDRENAAARFWLVALYGTEAETKGVLRSLSLLKPIRHQLTELIRLNDRYQSGAGYRIMGILDYKVPKIAGGNKQRAIEWLEKAYAVDPASAFNNFYLGEYWDVMGEKEKAASYFKKALEAPLTPDVDAADLKMIQQKTLRKRAP